MLRNFGQSVPLIHSCLTKFRHRALISDCTPKFNFVLISNESFETINLFGLESSTFLHSFLHSFLYSVLHLVPANRTSDSKVLAPELTGPSNGRILHAATCRVGTCTQHLIYWMGQGGWWTQGECINLRKRKKSYLKNFKISSK